MKKLTKHISKLLLIMLTLTLANCEKENLNQPVNEELQQPKYNIKRVNKAFIESNSVLSDRLNGFSNNGEGFATSSREVYNDEYGFTVEADEAIYIEHEEYHSYTFAIYREESNGLVENLLLSLNSDMDYSAYLVSYDLTSEEERQIEGGEYVDLAHKISFQLLENYDADSVLSDSARTIYYEPYGDYCYTVSEETSQGTGWQDNVATVVPCPPGMGDSEYVEDETDSGGGSSPYENNGDTSGGQGAGTGTNTNDPENNNDSTNNETGNTGGSGNTSGTGTDNTNEPDPIVTTPVVDVRGSILRRLQITSDSHPDIYDWVTTTTDFFTIYKIDDFFRNNTGEEIDNLALEIIEAAVDGSLVSVFPFVKYPTDLAQSYRDTYPKITEYLENELPKLVNNTALVNALKEYGSLSAEQVKEKLTWGNGPEIKYTPLSATHNITGRFNGLPIGADYAFEGPDVIELNTYTFADVEEHLTNGGEFNSSTFNFFIAIVVLHEMTHYGDFHYNGNMINSSEFGETGVSFETEVFGTTIDYPNDLGIVQEYLIKLRD